MKKTILANLGFHGVYDNGHDFLQLDPHGSHSEVVEFEDLDEAIKFVEENEVRYVDIMEAEVRSYKRSHKHFNPGSLEAFVHGFVDIEVDGKLESQVPVFHKNFEVEIEEEEDNQ